MQQFLAATSFGNDFYIGFMRNLGGTSFTSLKVHMSTTVEIAEFVIDSNTGFVHRGSVSTGEPVSVELPTELQVVDGGFIDREKGVHIYTTNNVSINVLAENSVSPLNFGVFLAYPCFTIENDDVYEYYVLSTQGEGTIHSQVLLVGCEDNTTITVSPTQSITVPLNTQESSSSVTVNAGEVSSELLLNSMQTILITSANDLTATKIVSNKPLTVISGHECANIPFSSDFGCEPLAVQVPPSTTWGTRFLLAPFAGRTGDQFYKIVSENTTNLVYTCGSETRIAPDRIFFEFSSSDYCFLESQSAPVMVVQLSFGGSIDNMGDPAISLISPINQYIGEVAFISFPTNTFPSNYISITVSSEHYTPENILLDGNMVACTWQALQNSTGQTVGYGCSLEVASGSNSFAQHNISHSNSGLVSVLVYGFSGNPGLGYAYLSGQLLSVETGK